LLGGNAITYANIKSGFFEFIPGIDIIYPGNTMQKPIDIAEQICKAFFIVISIGVY
jgi:hypothetical protein